MFRRITYRLARPADRLLLDSKPSLRIRLGVVARICRRFIWAYVVILLVALVVTAGAGMDIYHRTEMPQFCSSCHEMKINATTWKASQHKSIKCVDCHARPGMSGWIEAKVGGLRQLVKHFRAKSIDNITVNDHQRGIVSDNCHRCHPGSARLDERAGLRIAHQQHLKQGVACGDCHSRYFAHPKEDKDKQRPADWRPPLVEFNDCFKCHDGKRAFGKDKFVAFAAADQKNCARCHPDADLANTHGGGDHACKDCHDRKGRHFDYDAKKIAPLCGKCHDEKKEFASTHKPYAEGKCLSCHKVMVPAYLHGGGPKPTAAACLTCHKALGKALGRDSKTLTKFSDGDDDLHRRHAEELAGKQANACRRCHPAHGSENAGLVAFTDDKGKPAGTYTKKDDGGTCQGACHDDEVSYARKQGGGR